MNTHTLDRPIIQASDSSSAARYTAERTAPRVPLITPEARAALKARKSAMYALLHARGILLNGADPMQNMWQYAEWLKARRM